MPPALCLVEHCPGTVLAVPASLSDFDALLEFRAEIDAVLDSGETDLVLDCSELRDVSGPAVGWLVHLASRLHGSGGTVELADLHPQLQLRIWAVVRGREGLVLA